MKVSMEILLTTTEVDFRRLADNIAVAHSIRNSSTNAFKAVNELDAQRRWCLTGTPVHNRLEDLFSLARFLRYYPFATASVTRDHITRPLQNKDQKGLTNLQHMMKIFSLRRVKDSSSIPRRHDREVAVKLSKSEQHQYEVVRKEALSSMSERAKNNLARNSHIVLQAISRWRQ